MALFGVWSEGSEASVYMCVKLQGTLFRGVSRLFTSRPPISTRIAQIPGYSATKRSAHVQKHERASSSARMVQYRQ